jgi:hypothetical protein
MKVTGKLVNVLNTQNGKSTNGKEWVKKDFVIETDAKYNPEICFTLFGKDKVSLLDDFSIGNEIEVHFNLSSREYKGKYYTQAQAWKIESVTTQQEEDEFIAELNEDIPF